MSAGRFGMLEWADLAAAAGWLGAAAAGAGGGRVKAEGREVVPEVNCSKNIWTIPHHKCYFEPI